MVGRMSSLKGLFAGMVTISKHNMDYLTLVHNPAKNLSRIGEPHAGKSKLGVTFNIVPKRENIKVL